MRNFSAFTGTQFTLIVNGLYGLLKVHGRLREHIRESIEMGEEATEFGRRKSSTDRFEWNRFVQNDISIYQHVRETEGTLGL
jgi:hypothetical protein